jgi:hypothetical protein
MRNRLPMALSITALFVAVLGITPLGDAAYNAVVPRNSVGTLQLQRNAVKAAKIAPNAIRTGHVLDGTLLTSDFKTGQIPQGPKGDKGDKGDKGEPGATNVVVRQSESYTSPGGALIGRTAACQSGERAIGGGGALTNGGGASAVKLIGSRPQPFAAGAVPTGWVAFFDISAADITVSAFVVCAKP